MNGLKRLLVFFLIALLTVVNVNFYRANLAFEGVEKSHHSSSTESQIDKQNPCPFSCFEQRGSFQLQLERICHKPLKISVSNWSFDKVDFVIRKIDSEVCYSSFCEVIEPGLKKPDIIFPFHYFW
ncbi:MAG TPA: hypothetical protein PKH79_11625 [Prolixibacteraceae bacterium]|nr:hypothetical protein [Prolixibacteraceae bacterium]HPS12160.1 hypothetical protein [Prolixibacteraceae bacterium]